VEAVVVATKHPFRIRVALILAPSPAVVVAVQPFGLTVRPRLILMVTPLPINGGLVMALPLAA
jgi:hypothetical protein